MNDACSLSDSMIDAYEKIIIKKYLSIFLFGIACPSSPCYMSVLCPINLLSNKKDIIK